MRDDAWLRTTHDPQRSRRSFDRLPRVDDRGVTLGRGTVLVAHAAVDDDRRQASDERAIALPA